MKIWSSKSGTSTNKRTHLCTSQKHSQRDVQRQIELKTKSFQTWHRTQSPQAKHTPHMLSFGTRIPEVQSRKHPQSAKNFRSESFARSTVQSTSALSRNSSKHVSSGAPPSSSQSTSPDLEIFQIQAGGRARHYRESRFVRARHFKNLARLQK